MYERFTERARQVMVLGQDEARALRHNYIGTEHILLGLLREEEGFAARVLSSLNVGVGEVRERVARIVGQGDEVTTGQIPLTPRAKKACELALREALSLGHNYIGTEHLLLGLVRENAGVAARILGDLDASPEKIRNEIVRMLTGPKDGPIAVHTDIYLDGEEVARHVTRHQQKLRRSDHCLVYENDGLNVTLHVSGLSDRIWDSLQAAVMAALGGPDEEPASA